MVIEADRLFADSLKIYELSECDSFLGESSSGNLGIVNDANESSWASTWNFAQISQVTLRMFFMIAINFPRGRLPVRNTNKANCRNGLYHRCQPQGFPFDLIAKNCEDEDLFRVKYDQLWNPSSIHLAAQKSLGGQVYNFEQLSLFVFHEKCIKFIWLLVFSSGT